MARVNATRHRGGFLRVCRRTGWVEIGACTRRTRDRQRAVKGDRGAKKNAAVKRVASAERRRKWAVSRDKERGRKKTRTEREREKKSESCSMVYDVPLMAVAA